MAMSNSLGVGSDAGKTMAMNLTGLVGDIASFYNITVEEANTAISAVYTGETESIKKLGIVLTEANLNAYAVSQGIKKTYNQMSQAEKVMLRYNYVMQASAKIQGDFVRTGGNWANQVRVLKEQWSQLLGILGKGLIAVLNPVVKALNSMLASLIAVANAMAKAFGGTGIESSTGKVSSTVGDIADGAGDVTSGFDDANASAKALKNTLAGFDELNVLSSPNAGGGGVNIGGDVSTEGTGGLTEMPEAESSASKMADYLKQCKEILDKWVATIPKLQINFDKEKAIEDLKNIGLNIWNTIAGWGTFVVSLAIEVANDLDIGELANDFLDLLDNATALASTITDILIPKLQDFYELSGLSALISLIGDLAEQGLEGVSQKLKEWKEWFEKNETQIGTFVDNLARAVEPMINIVGEILKVTWSALGTSLSVINDAVQGIADAVIRMDEASLSNTLQAMLSIGGVLGLLAGADKFLKPLLITLWGISDIEFNWKDSLVSLYDMTMGMPLKDIFKPMLDSMNAFGTGITNIVAKIPLVGTVMITAFEPIKALFSTLLHPIQAILHPIETLKTLAGAVGTAVQSSFGTISSVFTALLHPIASLKTALTAIGGGFKAVWGIIAGNPILALITVITILVASIVTAYSKFEWFRDLLNEMFNEVFKPAFAEIMTALGELWNSIASLMEPITSLGISFKDIIAVIGAVAGTILSALVSGAIPVLVEGIKGVIQIFTNIIDTFKSFMDAIANLVKAIMSVFKGDWKNAWVFFREAVVSAFKGLAGLVKTPINAIITLLNGLLKGAVGVINGIIRSANKLPGINWTTFTPPTIPYLAKGGVITEPTVAMMGEYAGAYNNPEIVTPQNLLQQVIENSNQNVVDALIQQTRQLLVALEDIDMSVTIGDEQIAQSAQRGNLAYKRRTGKPLFA